MLHSIQNKSIWLGLGPYEHENEVYSWIQILEAKDAIFPYFLENPRPIQWVILAFFSLPLIIGTYFRSIVYGFLFEQYKKKELTSVNKLSFAVILADHLKQASILFATTLMVLNNESMHLVLGGNWFCIAQILYGHFAFYYSFIGSLGVSIYRILLIKHDHFLKHVIGEKVMLNVILYGGIILSLVFTTILNSHDYNNVFLTKCVTIPKKEVLQILDEYEQSRGNLSILSYFIKVNVGNGGVMAFMIFSEIIIYAIFFHHMYKHDNNDRLRRLLDPKVIRGRNRKNAITFIGQFVSFLFELTGILLMVTAFAIGTSANKIPVVGFIFRRYSFAIMSMFDVLTSDVLKKRLHKIELYNIIFGLN